MAQLSSLSPKLIWHFFEQICSIPHPSKHEAQLSAWIVQWAQGEGLAVKQDAVGNIIIKKPATPGMENRKAVVLQAHIDMVPQANADTQHDFTKDPIDAYIDGEWVNTLPETTLLANDEFDGKRLVGSPPREPSIRSINCWLTPVPPNVTNSSGVEGSAKYFFPLIETYEAEIILSSGSVGRSFFA